MDEPTFWLRLEYRICHEFAGLPERRYHYFWCDGFSPLVYLVNDVPPCITGKAWICNGQAQDLWDFVLLLPRPFAAREAIAWESLLPPPGVTRWIAFHESRRYLEMEPGVAVPDLA